MFLLSACSTTYRNPGSAAGEFAAAVKVGDYVTCTMRDETVKVFRVSQRDPTWLVGRSAGNHLLGAYLPDVRKIKVSRHSTDNDAEFILLATSVATGAAGGGPELPAWALGKLP